MEFILSKAAKKFIESLISKHAKQIAIKIKALSNSIHAIDSKKLKGSKDNYYRVDVGEYRIIYQYKEDVLIIILIGKRNDNEIYNLFKRHVK